MRNLMLFLLFVSIFLTVGCSVTPPKQPRNLCQIFLEKDDWYEIAQEVHQERGVPINIAMAFIYHESGYVEDARPPMRWFLFIPYGRGSSAFGYPQAQDPVWDDYKNETDGLFPSRSDFRDALDFVSWYMLKTKRLNGVPLTDAYRQYLNYHEGWGGYKRGSYKKNKDLQNTARNVERTAREYASQLRKCKL